jgi:hypothetical protein
MPGQVRYCCSNCFRLFIQTTSEETRTVNVIALPGKVAGNSAEAELLHMVPNSPE